MILENLTVESWNKLVNNNKIDINFDIYYSLLTILTWTSYDQGAKYFITDNNKVLVFIKWTKKYILSVLPNIKITSDREHLWISVKDKINDMSELLLIKSALRQLNETDDYLISNNISIKENLADNLATYELPWITNYIYEKWLFANFPTRKMQKKRAFMNFYIKNFEPDSMIRKMHPNDYDDVLEFCKKHILKDSDNFRHEEYDAIQKLLQSFKLAPDLFVGSILYYKNNIVGITLGYLNNNIYEIFLEKCDVSLKGIYQYLIAKNIEINKIQTEFIDRQDDNLIPGLQKSKHSYKPLLEIKRKLVLIS